MLALFKRDQVLRHRSKTYRRILVAWHDEHDARSDCHVQEHFRDCQVKIGLTQYFKEFIRVNVQGVSDFLATILRNVRAWSELHPFSVWREEARLDPVRKTLGRVDRSRIKHAGALMLTRSFTFILAGIEIALGQCKFVALFVDRAP